MMGIAEFSCVHKLMLSYVPSSWKDAEVLRGAQELARIHFCDLQLANEQFAGNLCERSARLDMNALLDILTA